MVKSIMVSDDEYKLLDEARNEIVHNGIKSLGEEVFQETKKRGLSFERLSRGTIIALGSILLLKKIKTQEGVNNENDGKTKK